MEYRILDAKMAPASVLIYGTGNGAISGDDEGAAIDCLDRAYAHGFTMFDSAYAYGNAEVHLGKWLSLRGLRDQVVILDKGCNPGQKGSADVMSDRLIRNQCEESLDRMQTDCTDYYVLHRDEESYPVGAVIEVLNALKEEGKLKRFGASNWSYQRICEANAYAKAHDLEGFSAVSPAYSLAVLHGDPWGRSVGLSGEAQQPVREAWMAQQMPVFCYSSLARGFLSGKFRTDGDKPIEACLWGPTIVEYDTPENRMRLARAEKMAAEKGVTVSQIALAWLFAQPLCLYPIVSPSSDAHMQDNADACSVVLSREEADWLLNG